jgi:nicotinamidase-related amidase
MSHLPAYYDPHHNDRVWIERVDVVSNAAAARARAPAQADTVRICAFGIDCQVAFCTPGASLFVPGAVDDTTRILDFLYRHVDAITGLVFSLDTHNAFQVFHPAWWTNAAGEHPAPMTTITHDDVVASRWVPRGSLQDALDYTAQLEATGRYVLIVWPLHALLGGVSSSLVPSLMEYALFHSLVRNTPTHFEQKGTHALTENYSVLSPEVRRINGVVVGAFNDALLDHLLTFDRIYVFGQASSHCVSSTLLDLQTQLQARDPAALSRIYILEDAMSPVPAPPLSPLPAALDFPARAKESLAAFAAAGMHVVRTTDPL